MATNALTSGTVEHPNTPEEIAALPSGARYLSPITSQIVTRGAANESVISGVPAEKLKPEAAKPSVPAATPASAAEGARYPASTANDAKFPPSAGVAAPAPAVSPLGGPMPPAGAGVAGSAAAVTPQHQADAARVYRVFHGMGSQQDSDALNAQSLAAAQGGRNYLNRSMIQPGQPVTNALTAPPAPPPGQAPGRPQMTAQQVMSGIADLRSRGQISQDGAASFVAGAPPTAFGPLGPVPPPGAGVAGSPAAAPNPLTQGPPSWPGRAFWPLSTQSQPGAAG